MSLEADELFPLFEATRQGVLSTGGIDRERAFINANQPEGTAYSGTYVSTDPALELLRADDAYVIVERGVDGNDGYRRQELVTVYKKQKV